MLASDASLIDVAFAVCTALDLIGESAVLVGGSAATFYAPEAYQSSDCDFILAFGRDAKGVGAALASLGFHRATEGFFRHPDLAYTVEFPVGPSYIGIDQIVSFATVHRGDEILRVFAATDVVRDRFMHFWAWGDLSALRVALDVAKAQRSNIDYDLISAWTDREMIEAPGAYDVVRCDLFLAELRIALAIEK